MAKLSKSGPVRVQPPVANPNLAGALNRIGHRGAQGEQARAALAEQLATLSLADLRKIDPSLVWRLGPSGLAHLLERSVALRTRAAGLVPPTSAKEETPIAIERKASSAWSEWLKRDPLPWVLAKSSALFVGFAVLFVAFVPLAWRIVSDPPVVGGEPLCRQLDPFTGDCTYRSGSNTLTMERAAAALRLPFDVLAAANPNAPAGALAPDTALRVPGRAIFTWR
jgi:hypothetical protein